MMGRGNSVELITCMQQNATNPIMMQTNYVQMVDLDELIGAGDEGNIFFIESDHAVTQFHPRLLCAFESAAMHNPNKRVGENLLCNYTVYRLYSYRIRRKIG